MTTHQPPLPAAQLPPRWATKLGQSARAVIPAGHPRLSRCLVALVGWVLGVGWSTATAMAAVTITELYPAPASGESEWVELYNDSPTDSVNLTGWWLQDQVSSPSLITTLSDLVLPPLSYITVNWTTSKLNNSGDTITLYNPTNQVIDQVAFVNSPAGQSWAKVLLNATEVSWSWQIPSPSQPNSVPSPSPSPSPSASPSSSPLSSSSPTPSPSPSPSNSPSSTPTPLPSPSPTLPANFNPTDLQLTAVMACPLDTQLEWVRLTNNSSQSLSLAGWYLTDAADNRRNLTGTLTGQASTTVEFTSSFINNTGETLWLYTPTNQATQTIVLPSCDEKGVAFNRYGSSWVAENQLNQPQLSPSPTPSPTLTSNTSSDDLNSLTDYLPGGFNNAPLASTFSATDQSLAAHHQAGSSAQLNQLLKQKPLKLDIPIKVTQLFQDPIKLFNTATTTTANGAWELIIGGGIISLSSAYQLVQKVVRLQ